MRTRKEITDAVLKYHPQADVDIIYRAYFYSAKAHRAQSRDSGEAYFSHPVEVAYNLTKLKMDEQTISAGLLHDTIEDTLATRDEIRELFGDDVYQLVEGVTKIGQVKFSSQEEKQAENYRKMILAMAEDIRVIMIKLADRAHNLKTLGPLSADRKKRIARETLEIYAPLANRLGMGLLKAELEDGSFKHLEPEEYKSIRDKVAQGDEQRQKFINKVCDILTVELKAAEIPGRVLGRPKHFYSIYKKIKDQNISFEDVYDLMGVRVLTNSVKDCYALLGLAHAMWKPIPGKFKDYIAMPKPNMYQSLHTTVTGPNGQRIEIQIRTEEMHRVSEEGIAAHWKYKEGKSGNQKQMNDQLLWVRHLIDSHKDLKNPKEFLNSFKVDLFPHEVYVFTPEGDVIALPNGATPVDFAYQVHTDIGHHCYQSKANGKIVPLRYKLRNGDRVEIITAKNKAPSRDWLSFVKTSKARNKIAQCINSEERARSMRIGTELLDKEIKKYGLNSESLMKSPQMEDTIKACGYNSLDSFLRALGYGKISMTSVIEKLIPKDKLEAQKEDAKNISLREEAPPRPRTREGSIRLKSLSENIELRVGKCCNPVPGDEIVGYITRGRGVSVHSNDCPSVPSMMMENERMIEVEWNTGKTSTYPCRVSIVTEDKTGLLARISMVVSQCDINITRANVRQGPHKRAYFDLSLEIQNLNHLNKMFDALKQVDGVIHAERTQEYNKKKKTWKNRKDDLEAESNLEQDSNLITS